MTWAAVSLVPVGVALAIALAIFAAWAVFMIRADRNLEHRLAAEAPSPLAQPVTAVVADVPRAPVLVAVEVAAPEDPHDDMWEQLAEPAPTPEPVVVRSGSFCTVVGATGVTAAGTEMVCTGIEGSRPRWRRATRELTHT